MPSGKSVWKEKNRRVSKAKCAECKKELHGVPRLNPNEMKKLAKSKKRPFRPYGGYLCSRCILE